MEKKEKTTVKNNENQLANNFVQNNQTISTHPPHPPHPATNTYSSMSQSSKNTGRLKRNILQIFIEGTRHDRVTLSPDYIADICIYLGMNFELLKGHPLYQRGRTTMIDI